MKHDTYNFVCMSCQSMKQNVEKISRTVEISCTRYKDDFIFESDVLFRLFFPEDEQYTRLFHNFTVRIQNSDFLSLNRVRDARIPSLSEEQSRMNLLSILQHREPFKEVFDVHRKMMFSLSKNSIRYIHREYTTHYKFISI